MTSEAITFDEVGKRYALLEQRPLLIKSLVTLGRDKRSDLWALSDVNLRIDESEVVGVLGRNGAGKSTLLRLMAGVTQPTTGRVMVRGRVAPLISVGVGFYPEMSGRENVYVNGMLLGLGKEEIAERFEAIVAFAELGEFIDTPVKFYSSGMYMRLGFSVAVHTDPSIFLVDEVLAVGDLAFQMKCFDRMREIRAQGTTLVIVSHNVQAIRALCPRVVVVAHGKLVYDGDPEGGIALHHELLEEEARERQGPSRPGERTVVGGVSVVTRRLDGPLGKVSVVEPGTQLHLRVRVKFTQTIADPGYYVLVHDEAGTLVYSAQTPLGVGHRSFVAGEESEVGFRFMAQLEGGTYRITFAVVSTDGNQTYCTDYSCAQFFVDPGSWSYGIARLEGAFMVDGSTLADLGGHRLDGGSHLPSGRK